MLAWDYNKDILLVGHIHKGIPQIPNREDKDWAQFMQGLAFHSIHKNEIFAQQGGQNYTNIPLHSLLKC